MKKLALFIWLLIIVASASDNNVIRKRIPKDGIRDVKARISFSKGECLLKTADLGDDLMQGEFYFTKDLPEISLIKEGGMASLNILAEPEDGSFSVEKDDKNRSIQINPFSMSDENKWDVSLASDVNFILDISAGGASNTFKFNEFRFQFLKMEVGASKSFISFLRPNAIAMEELVINGGASKIECRQLANSRARKITVETGVGSCILDFSGVLRDDMEVEVSNGVGSIKIFLPEDAGAMFKVNSSFLSKFRMDEYRKEGDIYYSRYYSENKHHIHFFIDNTLGAVEVISVK